MLFLVFDSRREDGQRSRSRKLRKIRRLVDERLVACVAEKHESMLAELLHLLVLGAAASVEPLREHKVKIILEFF